MIKVLLLSLHSHSNKTKCCFVFWCLFCVNNLNVLRPRQKILSFSACSYCFMLFMLLFWLDWPQLMLAASWCAVLIVSRNFSPTLPQSSPFYVIRSSSVRTFARVWFPSYCLSLSISLLWSSPHFSPPFTVVWTALTVVTPEDPAALTLILLPPLPPLLHTTSSTITTATGTAARRCPSRPRSGSRASLPTTRASCLHRTNSALHLNRPRPCRLKQR